MTGVALLLLALALVAAVADWIAVDRDEAEPSAAARAVEALCKPLTLVLLIGVALALDPDDGAVRAWFVVALVLSLAGDVLLLLENRLASRPESRPGAEQASGSGGWSEIRQDAPPANGASGLFVAGLGAFLVGHVAYIGGMVVDGLVATRFGIGLAAVALAVAIVGVPILRAVRAGEPALMGPVTAYMVVISAMVACAAGAGRPTGVLGAALFYASDSLIAWNRFVRPLPHGRLAIMSTYHLAQVGLVLSLIW